MSKQAEAVTALRSMTAGDLAEYLQQQRRRLFEVRFQQAAGQVENHRQIREIRREIARTMTLQLELTRGHHLGSDLEIAEEVLEEQPRPRRFRRRREAAEGEVPGEPPEAAAGAGTETAAEAAGEIDDATLAEIAGEDATGADEDVQDE